MKDTKQWEGIFDVYGNFDLSSHDLEDFDPQRYHEDDDNYVTLYNKVFDDNGYCIIPEEVLTSLIEQNNWPPFRDAVTLWYALQVEPYVTAVYFWK